MDTYNPDYNPDYEDHNYHNKLDNDDFPDNFDEFDEQIDEQFDNQFDEQFDEDNDLDLPEKPSVRFSDQVEEIAIPSRRKPLRCGNPNCKVDHSLPQQKEEDKKYSDGMWTTAILVILVLLVICLYLYFKWNVVRLKSICWILLIILIIVACLRSYFEISETKPI